MRGTCEYMIGVQGRDLKLRPCMEDGEVVRIGPKGGRLVYLCPIHAEFVRDAYSKPVKEVAE